MSKFAGFVLLSAGIGLAVHSLPGNDGAQQTAAVTRILTQAPEPGEAGGFRNFSPDRPLVTSRGQPPAPMPGGGSQPSTAAANPGWAAVITRQRTDPPASEDRQPVTLARRIQEELRRAGCYQGDIDGSWGPATKAALRSFMDRVNATLPMNEPDFILLTLVKGRTGVTCGAGCPSGQSLTAGGSCVPSAIMAKAGRSEPGGRFGATSAQGDPAGALALSVPVGASRLIVPAPQPVLRPALPGRMAVGAPVAPGSLPQPGEPGALAYSEPSAPGPVADDSNDNNYTGRKRRSSADDGAYRSPPYTASRSYEPPRRVVQRRVSVQKLFADMNQR